MDLDLQGRIGNTKLPLSNGLYPLFEAISNSIHAIEEVKEKKGLIEVEVVRLAPTPGLYGEDASTNLPILGFVIQDNGIGFTDANFKSFQTSDSTKKKTKGGKGVGRFLWLKAFDRVEVESVYEQGGRLCKRTFEFQLTEKGVEKEKMTQADTTGRKTTVRLAGFKAAFRQHQSCPKSAVTIARKIVEHFLESFILATCPKIRVRDQTEQTDLDLNHLFTTEMLLDVEGKDFQIKGQKFHITHVRLLAPQDLQHSIALCAHKRSVKSEVLEDPAVPGKCADRAERRQEVLLRRVCVGPTAR
jgi:anti-sigma regulatory factor (Ser/Thr protein kinase)